LDKVKKKDQLAVKKALNRISHASNRREAIKAYWRFCSRWRKAYPRAVACLKKDLDQLLSFFQIKKPELWSPHGFIPRPHGLISLRYEAMSVNGDYLGKRFRMTAIP
jgi:Transposase, Mutator family